MSAEAASLLALIISAVNSIVGFGVFMLHCKGDKRRQKDMTKRIDDLG